MIMDKFINAWVFPDGSSQYTNQKSHMLALQEFGLQEKLYEKAKLIQFSEDELQKHYDFDIGYIAMKLGYVRVVSFNNQFAVQYLGALSSVQTSAIMRIALEMQRKQTITFSCFALEEFQSGNTSFSSDLPSFKQELLKKTEQ